MNQFTKSGFIVNNTEFRYNCTVNNTDDISIISVKEDITLRILPSGRIKIWDNRRKEKIK